jgi:regulator of cell morphogenesis and NO signaling
MTITETTTVAEIAAALPSSVRVFQRHGIDFCCGGKTPLATACREHGLSIQDVSNAIEAATAETSPSNRDWQHEPLHALVMYIVETYHHALREELPRLRAMASKVARVHGSKSPHLARLTVLVNELSDDLLAHMDKEEMILFPAIVARETAAPSHGMPLSAPIHVMEHEHDRAGDLLAEMRRITDGYVAPEWGCQTFRALYHGLEELESAMHVHVHLENNILFPRALAAVPPRNGRSDDESAAAALSSRAHLLGVRQVLSRRRSRLRQRNNPDAASLRAVRK